MRGQSEHDRIGRFGLQQRFDGCQGLIRLTHSNQGLGQQAARRGSLRRALHRPDQQGFGLFQGTELERGVAGEHQHTWAVRRTSKHLIGQFQGAFGVALVVGQHGLKVPSLLMPRQRLLEFGPLQFGTGEVLCRNQRVDHRRVRRRIARLELQALAPGGDRGGRVAGRCKVQQVTFEQPGGRKAWCGGQQCVHLLQRPLAIAVHGAQASAQEHRLGVVGGALERLFQQCIGTLAITRGDLGGGEQRL